MSRVNKYLNVTRYNLEPEQAKKVKEGCERFGLECFPWSFGCCILARDPRNTAITIKVGYVERRGSFPYLEIYSFDALPKQVKSKVELILEALGFGSGSDDRDER